MPRASTPPRGQALAEFALVVPILLVLLLAVGDLGRLFAAGIVVQSASRDAAEAGAQVYAQLADGSTATSSAVYAQVDAAAMKVACDELSRVPDSGVVASTTCTTAPSAVVVACVHDVGFDLNGTTVPSPGDPNCAAPPPGTLSASAESSCTLITQSPWSTGLDVSGLPYVEVRVCYRFDLLLGSSMIPAGPFFLQQASNFVVAAYPSAP